MHREGKPWVALPLHLQGMPLGEGTPSRVEGESLVGDMLQEVHTQLAREHMVVV